MRVTWCLVLSACARGPAASPEVSDGTEDATSDLSDVTDPPPVCPSGMVEVDGAFCVDRWEASLEERTDGSWAPVASVAPVGAREVRAVSVGGVFPQAYISADQAEAACAASGKRLCTSDEWLATCRGPEGRTWPYGDTYEPDACHDRYDGGHPVVDYFGTAEGVWDAAHMNDPGIDAQPGTLAATGSYGACVSVAGAYDLHGNVHEWVSDADGTFRGGFFADASINGEGCGYVTTAHDRSWHDYSTGFRCCADLGGR